MICSLAKLIETYNYGIHGDNPYAIGDLDTRQAIVSLANRSKATLNTISKKMNSEESKKFLDDLNNDDYLLALGDIIDAVLIMKSDQREVVSNVIRELVSGKTVNFEVIRKIKQGEIKGEILIYDGHLKAIQENLSTSVIDQYKTFGRGDYIELKSMIYGTPSVTVVVADMILSSEFNILSVRKVDILKPTND